MTDSEYTDNEYDSDYDSDYEEDDSYIFYEPEEQSLTKYNMTLCELYNRTLHGNESSDVLYHYLVHSRYKILDMKTMNYTADNINLEYNQLGNQSHDIFRNYKQIITRENYVKPEITECIYLNTGHCIAILKTFWLRLIQRKWKNIIKARVKIINRRSHLKSLTHRELTGKWPNDCLIFPQLRGMLSQLKS
jgi:hypothetical protein